jgi:hypothetical protein
LLIKKNFKDFEADAKGDEAFNFWSGSACDTSPPDTVPVEIPRTHRETAFHYATLGLGNFLPFFVRGHNPASHDGFMNVILSLLPDVNKILEKGCYPFVRGDINIYNYWLKVCLCKLPCF